MKKYSLNIIVIFLIAISSSFSLSSCSKFSQMKHDEAKRHKKFEKDQKNQKKEEEAAYTAAVQKNFDMQQPQTQKMMRETAKKSEKYQRQLNHKKEFFLVRWWNAIFKPSRQKKPSKRNL